MKVNLFFEDIEILDLDPEFFVLWLSKVCRRHNKGLGDVNIIFCSDNYLLEINRNYLNHDYYTDIVTFNYNKGESINGDLFISVERVNDNAEKYNVSRETELNRVIIHGILHLIGFNDKTEEDISIIRAKEEEALKLIVSRET